MAGFFGWSTLGGRRAPLVYSSLKGVETVSRTDPLLAQLQRDGTDGLLVQLDAATPKISVRFIEADQAGRHPRKNAELPQHGEAGRSE